MCAFYTRMNEKIEIIRNLERVCNFAFCFLSYRETTCALRILTVELRIGCSASCARGKCHITDLLEAMALLHDTFLLI